MAHSVTLPSRALKPSKDGHFTGSVGHLFQFCTTPEWFFFFKLVSDLNLLSHSVWLLFHYTLFCHLSLTEGVWVNLLWNSPPCSSGLVLDSPVWLYFLDWTTPAMCTWLLLNLTTPLHITFWVGSSTDLCEVSPVLGRQWSFIWCGGCTFQCDVFPLSDESIFRDSYSTLETIPLTHQTFSVGPLLCQTLAVLSGSLGLLCCMCRNFHLFLLNLIMSLLYYFSSLSGPLWVEGLTFAFSLSPSS